jgi:hypothetical protein
LSTPGLELHVVARLHANADAGRRQRIGRSRGRQVGGEKIRPADAVVDEIGCGLALQELAIRQHQSDADRPEVVGPVLLVPERVKPRHRSRFDIRHGEQVADIVGAEQRTIGDEPVHMDEPALPADKLLQVEVELWLHGAKPDRASLDPTAEVGKEIGRVGERQRDAVALEIRPQPAPITGEVGLACRSRIVRAYAVGQNFGRKHLRCTDQGHDAAGQCQ